MKLKGIQKTLLGMLFIMLFMMMASPFVVATEDDDMSSISKLIVTGEGRATAGADRATVVLGVESRDESAAIAASKNAELMNRTIEALHSAGVADADISTSGYSLGAVPQEEPIALDEGDSREAQQFQASNMLTITLNDTSAVGAVLDAAISSGSNRIQEVTFDLRDPGPQKDRALTLAIEEARRKAQVAARAAGVTLGRILEISEGYSYVSSASRGIAFDVATPIEPSRMEVTASVTITYEIS